MNHPALERVAELIAERNAFDAEIAGRPALAGHIDVGQLCLSARISSRRGSPRFLDGREGDNEELAIAFRAADVE